MNDTSGQIVFAHLLEELKMQKRLLEELLFFFDTKIIIEKNKTLRTLKLKIGSLHAI